MHKLSRFLPHSGKASRHLNLYICLALLKIFSFSHPNILQNFLNTIITFVQVYQVHLTFVGKIFMFLGEFNNAYSLLRRSQLQIQFLFLTKDHPGGPMSLYNLLTYKGKRNWEENGWPESSLIGRFTGHGKKIHFLSLQSHLEIYQVFLVKPNKKWTQWIPKIFIENIEVNCTLLFYFLISFMICTVQRRTNIDMPLILRKHKYQIKRISKHIAKHSPIYNYSLPIVN